MKIVNRTDFLALPEGTLFFKCGNPDFGEYYMPLHIKGETIYDNDFFYQEITNTGGLSDRPFETIGESLPLNFYIEGRDGCFDDEQLFAVWEIGDLQSFIHRLGIALEKGYSGLSESGTNDLGSLALNEPDQERR